ncbi:MAG TPA: condensation domain-containing protein [Pyrinomonadaceae bacterium]|jgi:hypothetical protein
MSERETQTGRSRLSGAKLALLEQRLARRKEAGAGGAGIGRRPVQESAPASFSQEQVYRATLAEGRPSLYNMVIEFAGLLNVAALERALGEITLRHEILRTTFAEAADGGLLQMVAPPRPFRLALRDLSDLPEAERASRVRELALAQGRELASLGEYPPFRVTLFGLDETTHSLAVAIPHIICDQWSLDVLTRELLTLYAAFGAGAPSPLAPLAVQYADYAHWQRQHLQGATYDGLLDYWRRELAGCEFVLPLPTSRPRPPRQTFNGAYQTLVMPAELGARLEELSRRENVTLYMTLLAAYQVLLHGLTGREDVLVGSAVAGRDRVETEALIGCFINLVVLRGRLGGDPTFRELVGRTSGAALDAFAHQEMPFGRLAAELQPAPDPRYTPLVQTNFTIHPAPPASAADAQPRGLAITSSMLNLGRAAVDLTLSMTPSPRGLAATFEYNVDLFDESFITRLLEELQTLLTAVAADPERRLRTLAGEM